MEIERKWLIPAFQVPSEAKSEEITQGYLAIEPEGAEVRLRRADEMFTMTVKSSGDLTRKEREIAITREQFEELWPLAVARSLSKVRHSLPFENSCIEVDVYEGRHRGLIVAEVEFPDEVAARAFKAPAWFGQEVTNDKRYKNRNLLRSEGL